MGVMKRGFAAVLALALLLGCAFAEEGKYPTQWDLEAIYAGPEEWEADFERAFELLPGLEDHRGTLNTAQGIYACMAPDQESELSRLMNRLLLYAYMGGDLDLTDPQFQQMLSQYYALAAEVEWATAYIFPEIFDLPVEERVKIFSDPLLAQWEYYFSYFASPDAVSFSEETNLAIAALGSAMGHGEKIYNILSDVETPDPTIVMPDGSEQTLTDELYMQIVYGEEYDRAYKLAANELMQARSIPFKHTFASLLEATASMYWAYAQLYGSESTRADLMADSDLDPAIYDMLVQAARSGAEDYQRFLRLHAQAIGVEEQYPFDVVVSVSDYDLGEIAYDDAVDMVREALLVLGEEYIADFDMLVNAGVIDVYPKANKVGGAYSIAVGSENLPHILLNYMGYYADVSTLAHEMGHSMYSLWSARYQDVVYNNPTTFTHEVASITNEMLLNACLMNNAQSEDERLFYLEQLIEMFNNTFITQMIYAELEDYLYQEVEAGNGLTAEGISDRWEELMRFYRGDEVVWLENARYGWIEIPHLHYGYYVYQYASSLCYAAAISGRILNGEEGALEAYLEFLHSGASMAPGDLLAIAGVDPLSEETYEYALHFYKELVDEYEALLCK